MENLLFLSLDIVKYNENGQVTIASSIFILVFSMIVVFVVLLIISYMIDIMHFVLMSKTKSEKVEKCLEINKSDATNVNTTNDLMADTKLVAIITAAISSYMGTASSNIHIKNIRRVEQNSSNWSMRNIARSIM